MKSYHKDLDIDFENELRNDVDIEKQLENEERDDIENEENRQINVEMINLSNTIYTFLVRSFSKFTLDLQFIRSGLGYNIY